MQTFCIRRGGSYYLSRFTTLYGCKMQTLLDLAPCFLSLQYRLASTDVARKQVELDMDIFILRHISYNFSVAGRSTVFLSKITFLQISGYIIRKCITEITWDLVSISVKNVTFSSLMLTQNETFCYCV